MADFTTKSVGKHQIIYSSELGFATVQEPGLLVPLVVYEADDPDAVEKCEEWITIEEQERRIDEDAKWMNKFGLPL